MPQPRTTTYAVVESGKRYAPGFLMASVAQWRPTAEEDLRSLAGVAPLIPDYGDGLPAAWASGVSGLYHAELWGSSRNVTLVRCGAQLLEQAGWDRSLRVVQDGLTANAGYYPDAFASFNDRVIWTNGLDRPHIYDGECCAPLGFSRAPAAPVTRGPLPASTSATQSSDNPAIYRNNSGYSHPGRIGTPGDALDGQWGAMLAGSWLYKAQWEDVFGNVSPLSGASAPVTIRTEQTAQTYKSDFLAWSTDKDLGAYAVHIDDIQRQFGAFVNGAGPDGTVAVRLYRTRDTQREPTRYFLVDRYGGYHQSLFIPDNTPDALLTQEALDVLPVPPARLVCAHGGRVVLANSPTEPGMLMVSALGLAGTYPVQNKVYPDASGAQVTGLVSYGGELIAFTREGAHVVTVGEDGVSSRALFSSGCVAPASVVALTRGGLLWLGPSGVCFWQAGAAAPESVSDGISDLLLGMNAARARYATAAWDEATAEYLLAVSPAGTVRGGLLLGWDGRGWRRYNVPAIWSMARTMDFRRYILLGCATRGVLVFDAVAPGQRIELSPPLFQSRWLAYDADGVTAFNLEEIGVAFVGASCEDLSVHVWRDNDTGTLLASGMLEASREGVDIPASEVVLGAQHVDEDGIVWRRRSFSVQDCRCLRFEIRASSDQQKLRVAGFYVTMSPVGGAERVRA